MIGDTCAGRHTCLDMFHTLLWDWGIEKEQEIEYTLGEQEYAIGRGYGKPEKEGGDAI